MNPIDQKDGALSDEELRIKIAEHLGWTFNGATKSGPGCNSRRPGDMQYVGTMNVPLKEQWTPPGGNVGFPYPPDYVNDLNAMAEAEKNLSREEGVKYRLLLSMNSDGPKAAFLTVEAAMCHATARQRSLAFVRTMEARP